MKKFVFTVVTVSAVFLFLSGCKRIEESTETSFLGTVLENDTTALLVEPEESADEVNTSDIISVSVDEDVSLYSGNENINIEDIQVGDQVKIYYEGAIAESYPAQISNVNRIYLMESDNR